MLARSNVVPALALTVGIGLAVSPDVSSPPADTGAIGEGHRAVSFSEEVLPIFERRCWECHSEQSAELGLKLDTYEGVMAGSDYGTVVEPGDPDGSLLVDMIAAGDMPEEGDPVLPEELELIKTWIAEGAENNE